MTVSINGVAIPVIEKTYTSWAIQGIYEIGVWYDARDFMGVRNDGIVIWHDWSYRKTYIVGPNGVLEVELTGEYGIEVEGRYRSVFDKYLLFIDEGFDYITVVSGLAELWKRRVDDDKGGYTLDGNPLSKELLDISPSGEWIVAMIKEAGGNGLIFIYKGS